MVYLIVRILLLPLPTRKIQFNQGNKTKLSIDIAIVKQESSWWQRLIHNKRSDFYYHDTYRWETVRDSQGLNERVEWLKHNDLWNEVRDIYLDKKNMYLRRPLDHYHPSFIVYIESVNEVYYKHIRK